MATNTGLLTGGNRLGDIHGIASKLVELGDRQNVVGLRSVKKPRELAAAFHCRAAADDSDDDVARLDAEAVRRDLVQLVVGWLLPAEIRSYADVRAIALNTREFFEIDSTAKLRRGARHPLPQAAN